MASRWREGVNIDKTIITCGTVGGNTVRDQVIVAALVCWLRGDTELILKQLEMKRGATLSPPPPPKKTQTLTNGLLFKYYFFGGRFSINVVAYHS